MNQLTLEKQEAIIQGYKQCSVRLLASTVGCSPTTVKTYLRKAGVATRSVSEAMLIHHNPENNASLEKMMTQYNVCSTSCNTLSCGRTRDDCVSCKEMFSRRCGFSYSREVRMR